MTATRFPLLLGAHTSSAGGTCAAPPRARAIGATAMQLFTKQANRWAERDCEGDETTSFRAAVREASLDWVCAHDSYLINLASPDPVLRARSLESFVRELRRCEALGLDALVSHPGNYMDERASGIARNADAITEALELVPGHVRLLLETTAGSGTALGATFEELAAIIERIPEPLRARVGVCVDTCHVFAAGYDLAGSYDDVWARFDDTIGLARLGAMHLNDSKTPLGSRRDRHELIGEGTLGEAPFRRIMTDERLAAVPRVIETPKFDEPEVVDRRMLERLWGYATGEGPASRTASVAVQASPGAAPPPVPAAPMAGSRAPRAKPGVAKPARPRNAKADRPSEPQPARPTTAKRSAAKPGQAKTARPTKPGAGRPERPRTGRDRPG